MVYDFKNWWLNTVVSSTKRHGVTWQTKKFQDPIILSSQKPIKTKNCFMYWLYPSQQRLISTKFFSLIKYSKRQKIKMGNLLCHTVMQGVFHQNHLEYIF